MFSYVMNKSDFCFPGKIAIFLKLINFQAFIGLEKTSGDLENFEIKILLIFCYFSIMQLPFLPCVNLL